MPQEPTQPLAAADLALEGQVPEIDGLVADPLMGAFASKKGIAGIRAADEDTSGRYRLHSQKNGASRLVTGKRFFAHNGLTIERARTFDAEADDGGIVGFCLTEEPEMESPAPVKKAGGRRRAKAA